MAELVELHHPDAVAIEESFVGADARTALSVGQARGAVMVAAANAGVECAEYPPARVKQVVCGYGRAEKQQVQKMVKVILGLEVEPDPDACRRRARRRDLPCARAAAAEDRGMIARLRGKPVANTPDGLVVDVGGVGYLVAATPSARPQPPTVRRRSRCTPTCTCARTRCSCTASPRRPSASSSSSSCSVNGIGPKVALAIVSGSPAADLRRAIVLGDTARFQAIPGIGKKTAERIVLELKEKIGDAPVPISSAGSGSQPHLVARDALVELGYSLGEAELALARVDPELPPEERVREALKAA